MQWYALRNIHFMYRIKILDSLLEELQDFSTLKNNVTRDWIRMHYNWLQSEPYNMGFVYLGWIFDFFNRM